MSITEIKPICLRLLARREYSQKELMTKLIAKGFESLEIQTVIDTLKNQNFQSDERFAENYARARFYKGFGMLKISYELQQHQIENFDLQATLAENFDDEYQGIKQVYHKKYLCNT
ncbi:MAG: regulatory protein RecX [Methylococcales bacterium]|nr:regulatory protein RecX [Methylococcales bacterium]